MAAQTDHQGVAGETIHGLLESAPDAMVIVSRDGTIVLVNSQIEKLFDYRRDELLDQPVEFLVPERFRAKYADRRTECLVNPGAPSMRTELELCGRRKNGSEFPVQISLSPLQTEHGVLISSTIRDITKQRRVEESLRRSEERFRILTECLRDYAIFMLDSTGHVASWNVGAERIKGYRANEIIGQHFSQFYHDEDVRLAKPQKALERAVADGQYEDEGWRVRKDGSRFWANVVITPLRTEEGELRGFAKVTRDMTRLNEAHERALQAERLATIGAMVAGLAHESRNALQQIQSSVEMLTRRVHGRVEANLVSEIQKAQNRLLRLFEDVRAYATPLTLNRRLYNIANIWREAWRQLSPLRKNRQACLQEEDNELDLNCLVDQYAMERAFHNILLNSLSACADPAIIEIRYSETEIQEQRGVRVAICDNGPGLNPEQKEKIFEPFYTTKTKGTGLGMAITKRVVEAHGGQIDVGPNCQGTEIVITLPRGKK
jgi:PAS domain S-box-containing protein